MAGGYQIQGTGLASQTALAVVIGPIKVDKGECDVSLISKSSSGTVTTPTAVKLQYSHDNVTFADVTSGSLTPSSSSSAVVEVTKLNIVCRYLQVVAGGTFAAGNATISLWGIEKTYS